MPVWVKKIREEELSPVARMPQGGKWKRYVSQEADGRGMIFGMGSLAPGEEAGHVHLDEELFYVLQGSGEATWELDGETFRADLKPGVAFYKTSNIYHTMHNTGEVPLVGVFFKV